MNCKEFRKNITLIAEKEFPEGDDVLFEEHASLCTSCGKLLETAEKEIGCIREASLSIAHSSNEEQIDRIMQVVHTIEQPWAAVCRNSLCFKICYTLYNGLVMGVMISVLFFMLFGEFLSFEQVIMNSEARNAFFGAFCILLGCGFVLMPGREVSIWIAAHLRKGFEAFQIAPDAVVMVLAGVSFFACGSVIFLTGIF